MANQAHGRKLPSAGTISPQLARAYGITTHEPKLNFMHQHRKTDSVLLILGIHSVRLMQGFPRLETGLSMF